MEIAVSKLEPEFQNLKAGDGTLYELHDDIGIGLHSCVIDTSTADSCCSVAGLQGAAHHKSWEPILRNSPHFSRYSRNALRPGFCEQGPLSCTTPEYMSPRSSARIFLVSWLRQELGNCRDETEFASVAGCGATACSALNLAAANPACQNSCNYL